MRGFQFRKKADADAEFAEFLGDLVIELETLRSGNRILSLKATSVKTIVAAMRQVASAAAPLKHSRLVDCANKFSAMLSGGTGAGVNSQDSFLIVQSFHEFLEEAHLMMRKGADQLRTADPESTGSGQGIILCVDDEAIEHEIVARALGSEGQIVTASSVAEAVEILSKTRPRLILLDVNLGLFSGTDLLTMLQKVPALRQIPVVIRSNYYDDDTVVAGLLGGAMDFVPKSAKRDELRKRVLEVMQNGRPRLYAKAG